MRIYTLEGKRGENIPAVIFHYTGTQVKHFLRIIIIIIYFSRPTPVPLFIHKHNTRILLIIIIKYKTS